MQRQIDTLIYGCTHYPYLAPILHQILPPTVKLIDPAVYVVAAAAQELDLLGLKNVRPPMPTRFCVSGFPQPFVQLASRWLGCAPVVEHVSLPDRIYQPATLEVVEQ
ncbi:hypothetical protein [Kovacikia minuta]|uniref:hypothetical protein n=1 Tax=Kovacikia minuta TaxID=2931930 RepID=UPI0036F3AC67